MTDSRETGANPGGNPQLGSDGRLKRVLVEFGGRVYWVPLSKTGEQRKITLCRYPCD